MRDEIEVTNRRWRLVRGPEGPMRSKDFMFDREPLMSPAGQANVLLRHELLQCASTIRNWISGNRVS